MIMERLKQQAHISVYVPELKKWKYRALYRNDNKSPPHPSAMHHLSMEDDTMFRDPEDAQLLTRITRDVISAQDEWKRLQTPGCLWQFSQK